MGANPDDQDHTGLSALMHAVISGEDAAVYELLEHRPNLALHDRAGNTALDYAIIFTRQRAGQRLVGAGAEADLFQTAALGLRTRVAKISSDPPTLLRVRDARGYSAVQWAILRDQPEVLDLLTQQKTDLDPYELAALNKANELRRSIDKVPRLIDSVDPLTGLTLLQWAALGKAHDTAKLLLQRNADPSSVILSVRLHNIG